MIDQKIQTILSLLNDWCTSSNIQYDIICDESNFQVIKLFKVSKTNVDSKLDDMYDEIVANNVHINTRKVRGGVIIVISLKSISEQQMDLLAESIDGNNQMSFADKINAAFLVNIPISVGTVGRQPIKTIKSIDFDMSAMRIVESRKPKKRKKNKRTASLPHISTHAEFGAARGNNRRFDDQLTEALDQQTEQPSPRQLFDRFSRALNILGQNMGTGPLQDVLKQRGIKWKKSDDGKNIILYVINASTNAPQPIETISAEVLDKPHDFQEQLTHMLDYAQGQAPGEFLRQQQQLRDQEKMIRDVAQSVSPDEQVQATKIAAMPKA